MNKPSPLLSVVDSHAHFWDRELLDYSWLEGIDELAGPFLPHQIPPETGGLPIEQVIFVQNECAPHQADQEVEWVTSLRKADPRITGMVAFAALEDAPAAQSTLDAYGVSESVHQGYPTTHPGRGTRFRFDDDNWCPVPCRQESESPRVS